MRTRIMMLILLLAVLVGCSEEDLKPNILIIVVDDLGWKDLGFQGGEYFQTPNLDKLASRGLVFTNAYATASNCAPSRACMLTGRYAPRHGIFTVANSDRGPEGARKLIPTSNETVLADSLTTFAEVFREQGYRTLMLGKWHLGEDPETQGFDTAIGGNRAGHPRSYFSPYQNPDLPDGPEGEYLTDRLTEEAMRLLEEPSDQPFLMYLSFYSVHTPLQPKPEVLERYQAYAPGGIDPRYAAMVEIMDRNTGRILDKLDELGLTDNTFVVFTSDNGGVAYFSSQYPLRGGKGTYFDGGIRVPMVMRWPGHVAPGKSDQAVSNLDFFPTLLDLAALEPPPVMLDGLSLASHLTEGTALPERDLFWHFPIYLQAGRPHPDNRDPLFRTRPGSVIRSGKWKLHAYYEEGELELYDLEYDLNERVDLSDSLPEVTEELHRRLMNWRKRTGAPVPSELNPAYTGLK